MSSKRAIRRRSCSGKVRHTSQANAEVARRVMIRAGRAAPDTMNAYRCQFCGGYHVGTRPGTGALRPAPRMTAPCDCWRCRSGLTHVQVAGRLVDLHRGPPSFNDQRAVEGQKAGYGSQVRAERDRAKFPRKRK